MCKVVNCGDLPMISNGALDIILYVTTIVISFFVQNEIIEWEIHSNTSIVAMLFMAIE